MAQARTGNHLAKGDSTSLTKQNPGLTAVTVAFGWENPLARPDPVVDASALACGDDGNVLSDQHFIFYNNLTSPDGSISHSGDHERDSRSNERRRC